MSGCAKKNPVEKEPNVLSRLLSPARVILTDGASDKWAAIRHLVDVVVDNGDLAEIERPRVLNAVYERERTMSTGIERGLAIPHGVYDGVPRELGVLGIFRDGVDFQARDGRPSEFVFMLLYPSQARQEHVENLAGIVRAFSSPELRDGLRETGRPEDVYERLAFGNCEESP